MDKLKLQSLEELYLKAKKTYYAGNPIMTDKEFDDLEEILKSLNSKVIDMVGSPTTVTKPKQRVAQLFDIDDKPGLKSDKHNSKMLSLAKVNTEIEGIPPTTDVIKWYNKLGVRKLIGEPKYDGNGVNIIYKKGKFFKALSRGDGIEGFDISDKIRGMMPNNVPETISLLDDIVEIRGEVLIKVDIFIKKYKFAEIKVKKNPRNFVAGKLNPASDTDRNVMQDLTFIPYDVRIYTPDIKYSGLGVLVDSGFTLPFHKELHIGDNNFSDEFKKTYHEFEKYRETCEFQLDGFVIKTNAFKRAELGETGHHPSWALAIKFLAKTTETEIIDIEWNIGKTGELTPVGILEPVDLEGSTITRVTLHNAGYVLDNKVYPGAIISIAKKGDIVPGLDTVIKPSDNKYELPKVCPYCHSDLELDNMHLICSNDDCKGKKFYQFIYGVNSLELDFFGEATLEKIFYNTSVNTAFDLFDKTKFNKQNLIMKAGFPDGKNVDRIIEQVDSIKEISIQQTLLMIGIPGLGKRVSEELAKKIARMKYSTYGLEKRFFDMFDTDGEYYPDLIAGLKILKDNGIKIKKPKDEDNIKTVEFTGEPPEEFANKKEFAEYIYKFDYKHTSLKRDTDYLITNDYNSNTGKMQKAKEFGIKIITYEDFINFLKNK